MIEVSRFKSHNHNYTQTQTHKMPRDPVMHIKNFFDNCTNCSKRTHTQHLSRILTVNSEKQISTGLFIHMVAYFPELLRHTKHLYLKKNCIAISDEKKLI